MRQNGNRDPVELQGLDVAGDQAIRRRIEQKISMYIGYKYSAQIPVRITYNSGITNHSTLVHQ